MLLLLTWIQDITDVFHELFLHNLSVSEKEGCAFILSTSIKIRCSHIIKKWIMSVITSKFKFKTPTQRMQTYDIILYNDFNDSYV
jgi:hypothetical protein